MDIILAGPTAVGKTELSIELAQRLNVPVISADSRQCFRYMDIGTAKPSETDLSRATHFNVSNLDPSDPEDAAAFVNRCNSWKVAHPSEHWIFAGGSTLYLQSLLFPLDDIPKNDPRVVATLEQRICDEGIESLYKQLQKVDPAYAAQMDGFNRQRIIRALAVWEQTGKPFSSFHQREDAAPPANSLVFVLSRDRNILAERIAVRTRLMIEQGLILETQHLLEQGYSKSLNALNTVGYKEAMAYIDGQIDDNQLFDQICAKTRQYARRQLTWFRRWKFATWLDMDALSTQDALQIIHDRIVKVERHQKLP